MSDRPRAIRHLDVAQFWCEAPASPARVLALAQFVQDGLHALLGRPPSDEEFTLVIRNREMRATLRAWGREPRRAGQALERMAREPATVARKMRPAQRSEVARQLRLGLERLRDARLVIADALGRHRTSIDSVVIGALRGIESERPERRLVRGDADEISPVLAVWRRISEGPDRLLARVRLEGQVVDVGMDPGVVDLAFEALKRGGEARLTVDCTWETTEDGPLTLVPGKCVLLGIELLQQPPTGQALMAALREFMTPEQADDVTRAIYEDREIELQGLGA